MDKIVMEVRKSHIKGLDNIIKKDRTNTVNMLRKINLAYINGEIEISAKEHLSFMLSNGEVSMSDYIIYSDCIDSPNKPFKIIFKPE